MAKGSGVTRSGSASSPKGVSNKASNLKYNRESQYDHEDYIDDYDERIDYIKSITGVSDAKAKQFEEAISDYTGGGYDLREANKTSELLEEFIRTAPKWDGDDLYRGTAADFSNVKVGDIISRVTEDGKTGRVSSWSTDRYFAAGSGDDTLLHVSGRQNATSVKFGSQAPDENEVLMSGNSKFMVVGIDSFVGMPVIELERIK